MCLEKPCTDDDLMFFSSASSSLQYDLEAIRNSGVRVIFLLASCRSYHVILSAARKMNMLQGYAWILFEPQGVCEIGR